jgi:hypothetical protein
MSADIPKATRKRFAIEERRRQVAKLYALGQTEAEMAAELDVDQKTISTDLKALRHLSQQFVFDLAKSGLAAYYKQSIDGIEYVLNKSYKLIKAGLVPQYELLALRLIKDCAEAKFDLVERGPSVLNARMLEERVDKIVAGNGNGNSNVTQKQQLR